MYVFISIYISTYIFTQDFPLEIYSDRYKCHWASQAVLVIKNLLDNTGDLRDTEFIPWVREDPLEKGMETHSRVLAWRFHGRRTWQAAVQGRQRVGHNWVSRHTHKHHWASLHLYAPELNILKLELNICCKTPSPDTPAQRLMTWSISLEKTLQKLYFFLVTIYSCCCCC